MSDPDEGDGAGEMRGAESEDATIAAPAYNADSEVAIGEGIMQSAKTNKNQETSFTIDARVEEGVKVGSASSKAKKQRKQ